MDITALKDVRNAHGRLFIANNPKGLTESSTYRFAHTVSSSLLSRYDFGDNGGEVRTEYKKYLTKYLLELNQKLLSNEDIPQNL
jgi:hypothetical protein